MRGDGHTAFGGNSPCIDSAVDAFMFTGALPAAGTTCKQDVPFEAPPALTAQALRGSAGIRAVAAAAPHEAAARDPLSIHREPAAASCRGGCLSLFCAGVGLRDPHRL